MADRNTTHETGKLNRAPVAAATVVYYGHIAARDAAGNLVAASDTAGLKVVGMTHETADNSAGVAGAEYALVRRGFAAWYGNDATNPVTEALVGSDCYVKDSETVCAVAGATNNIVAGKALELDSILGVKVLFE